MAPGITVQLPVLTHQLPVLNHQLPVLTVRLLGVVAPTIYTDLSACQRDAHARSSNASKPAWLK